jgi:arsenite-transporting ATPase
MKLKVPRGCLQVVGVALAEEPTMTAFEELSAGTARKYVMVSGKGGVGKTSLAASLAVKFAAAGHPTLVVSTDPAHSLSDSLDQVWPPAPHVALSV